MRSIKQHTIHLRRLHWTHAWISWIAYLTRNILHWWFTHKDCVSTSNSLTHSISSRRILNNIMPSIIGYMTLAKEDSCFSFQLNRQGTSKLKKLLLESLLIWTYYITCPVMSHQNYTRFQNLILENLLILDLEISPLRMMIKIC